MDIRTLHTNCMSKLRNLLPKKARIKYKDGTSYVVPCTINKEDMDMLKYGEYVGKDIVSFNILAKDLKDVGAPIADFMYIEYDRVRYVVHTVDRHGIFNNTITLTTSIFRDDING